MELAEPDIITAFRRCIEKGATKIICHPYFLSYGRHVQIDIPNLVEIASREYPTIPYVITEPVGMDDEIIKLINNSISKAKGKIQ